MTGLTSEMEFPNKFLTSKVKMQLVYFQEIHCLNYASESKIEQIEKIMGAGAKMQNSNKFNARERVLCSKLEQTGNMVVKKFK